MRNACVVHQHVEATQFITNTFRCRSNGGLIGYVELDRAGIAFDVFCSLLALFQIARPDEHAEAACRKVLRDLKTDYLIGPGDQGDGFVLHNHRSYS